MYPKRNFSVEIFVFKSNVMEYNTARILVTNQIVIDYQAITTGFVDVQKMLNALDLVLSI